MVMYKDGWKFPENFGWARNLGLVGDDEAAALEVTSALISAVCECGRACIDFGRSGGEAGRAALL